MKIVITGASSGIGKALAQYYTKREDEIFSIDRHHGFDLRTIWGLEIAVNEVNTIGDIDVLINNAGVMLPFETDEEMDLRTGRDMIHVNLTATWYFMKYIQIRRKTPQKHGGNIINIASIAGINHDGDTALYSATKAGVISLTKAYAKLYAPIGVRVNSISPGLFDTNLVPEPTPDWLINKVPLKYEEQPEKLCPIVNMILNTKYMTGANIVVDGGLSL
jgi:3-oxoacyl-[acyl-carrier protein] reductase